MSPAAVPADPVKQPDEMARDKSYDNRSLAVADLTVTSSGKDPPSQETPFGSASVRRNCALDKYYAIY